jgi:hypothetical protein
VNSVMSINKVLNEFSKISGLAVNPREKEELLRCL